MTASLHPVRDKERIVTLDILRGIAILGILYLNILSMGGNWPAFATSGNPQAVGASMADQWAYRYIFVLLEGTQRGLLELLFGASAILLTLRATAKDGPVEVADIYYRRALWLVAFGVAHGTLLLWWGEIWTIYGLAALFLFPFRRVAPRALAAIGALGLILSMAIDTPEALDKVRLQDRVEQIRAKPVGKRLTKPEEADMKRWKELVDKRANSIKELPDVKKAMQGSYVDNLKMSAGMWTTFASKLAVSIGEALFTMLIGMALFKWGVLQGARSSRFYLILAILGYGIGITVKMSALNFAVQHDFGPVRIGGILYDYGRMGTTLGHVGLICLILASGLGRRALAIFAAPGRMPMTAYVGQTLICCWLLFPAFGLGLWGRYGWADLMLIATAVNALLLVFCTLWLRSYRMGPLEWVWRWLSYRERPAFRQQAMA